MFRKKKTAGKITILEDKTEDGIDTTSSLPPPSSDTVTNNASTSKTSNIHPKPDFGFDSRHLNEPAPEELNNMTDEQLQQLIQSSADAGKQSTTRALRIATEAREIGANTAAQMQQQTAQLDKMTEDIEEVHDYLDKSESTIEKMTKNRIVRMFQVKKAKGKGLEQHKASKKEQESLDELRSKGLDAIDVKGMQNQNGVISMNELQREELLGDRNNNSNEKEGKKFSSLFSKKNQKGKIHVDTKDIEEDYSQYSDGVANVLRKQDEDLDQISDLVGDMKVLATAMNNELEYQSNQIDQVQDFTTETSRRTKQNAKKIAKIK